MFVQHIITLAFPNYHKLIIIPKYYGEETKSGNKLIVYAYITLLFNLFNKIIDFNLKSKNKNKNDQSERKRKESIAINVSEGKKMHLTFFNLYI